MRSILVLATSAAMMATGISHADDIDDHGNQISPNPIEQGFLISPVKLNLKGKNVFQVGWGSYLVNAVGDCSGCHSFPQFLPTLAHHQTKAKMAN